MIIADPLSKEHITRRGHPESPMRYSSIMEALKGYPIIHPSDASEKDLLRCHTQSYIESVKQDIALGKTVLSTDPENVDISPRSYDAALRAAGAVIMGVRLVMKGKTKTAFCVIRPPGHHACSDRGMGFCLFNNIAIGARYAQEKYGIKKVLIVDWDVHHGNGTEEIFYDDPSVFYFSTHQTPLYPGTGSSDETGAGNILNIPIQAGGREEVLKAYLETLPLAMKKFQPEFVMISAGFDAHQDDPLGGLMLRTEDFGIITEAVKKIAEEYASGRIVSALEGGYNLKALADSAKIHVEKLASL